MAQRTGTTGRPPVLTPRQTGIICAPLLGIAAGAIACGNQAAGIFAAGVTLILWAAILKFTGAPDANPTDPPPRSTRPVFVGPTSPLPPAPPATLRAAKLRALAANPTATAGERANAEAALRRLEAQR